MVNIFKQWLKHNMLLKIASFNSIAIFFRLLSGFIVSKSVAYFLLPQGMAITGNLRSFLISCQSLSIGGVGNGIIKYTAEFKNNQDELKKIISTSFFLVLGFTVIVSIVLLLFSKPFSVFVFNDQSYVYVIQILALVLPLYTINIFLLSIINGLGKYKKIIYLNILGYIVNVILFVFLLWKYNLQGAVIAIVSIPSILLGITFFWIKEVRMIFSKLSLTHFSKLYCNGFSTFFVMTFFTAITIPVTHILIKNHIIDTIGLTEAGYWEAMRKISSYYLVFVTSLFSLYLLPKLSQSTTKKEFRAIVSQFYVSLLPIVIVGFIVVYLLRFYVIKIALTIEFLPTQDLFLWQLIGDFFKISAFIIAYQLQAKKMLIAYIIGELLIAVVTYFSSIYFISIISIKGAVIGHALSYMFYFAFVVFIFRKPLLHKTN